MEQRLANTWHLSVNENKFIETALLSAARVDGRSPFDYRELTIKFGREDGSSEVQLGQTHVISFVTAQLVQPYRDRPNEGSLSIYTEFSPMADPSYEAGRPGKLAVELGRIIDRGLRESRAVDTESLCVLTGKLVWSVRVDLHVLDNGGNLLDAANIAALAALLTFRRPECSLGGVNGQEVIVHPPEVHEPQALIVHHLPIAVTFAFMTDDNIVVVDPTYYEEAIMKGRMTATVNANEDVCSIQKSGEVGITLSVVMHCLRTASVKAADITSKIENAVKMYNSDREHRTVKLLSSVAVLNINPSNSSMEDNKSLGICERTVVSQQTKKLPSQEVCISGVVDVKTEKLSYSRKLDATNSEARRFMKGPSCWDPFSKGVDSNYLKASLVSPGLFKNRSMAIKEDEQITDEHLDLDSKVNSAVISENLLATYNGAVNVQSGSREIKSLKDAVKLKNKRKKVSLTGNTS